MSEESHWKVWPGFVSGSEANSTCQVRKLSHIAEILSSPDKGSWSSNMMYAVTVIDLFLKDLFNCETVCAQELFILEKKNPNIK